MDDARISKLKLPLSKRSTFIKCASNSGTFEPPPVLPVDDDADEEEEEEEEDDIRCHCDRPCVLKAALLSAATTLSATAERISSRSNGSKAWQ